MPLVQSSAARLVWDVVTLDDVPLIQIRARRFLAHFGVATFERTCVLIAASEAATNLIKHAGGGELSLARLDAPPRVVLETLDAGPGIDDPDHALTDFVSEGVSLPTGWPVIARRGTGTGLGSIQRMMDVTRLANRSGGGLRLEARKYLAV